MKILSGFLVIAISSLGFSQERKITDCTSYDGNKFKVVPKNAECEATAKPKPKPRPKPPAPKPRPPQVKECAPCPKCPRPTVVEKERVVEKEKITYNAWRIYVLGGVGQHGLKAANKPEGEQVDKYYDGVFGAGIDYNINENWSIGVQGLSNESIVGSVGLSFGRTTVK
jgi:hypothetical protein